MIMNLKTFEHEYTGAIGAYRRSQAKGYRAFNWHGLELARFL